MKREAIDKRRKYSLKQKEYILSKTGGKCAHCGKPLTISTMQKDHSIPWSKGGPSNVENIVPLCEECNTDKADKIYPPEKYFFYVKKPILRKMQEYFSKYLENVDYLYKGNLFPMDYLSYTNFVPLLVKRKVVQVPKEVVYRKAVYSDLNRIYNFFIEYNNKYPLFQNSEDDKKEIWDSLSYTFTYGTILYTEKSNGDLACVILASMELDQITVSGEDDIRLDNNKVLQPNIHLQFFLNTNIDIYPLYYGDNIPYSRGLANSCMYCQPLPYIIDDLFSYASLDKSVVNTSISGCSSDPRSEFILKSLIERNLPVRGKIYKLLKYGNILYTAISIYDRNISSLYNEDSEDFENASIEGLFRGSKLLYDRMEEIGLMDDWMKIKGFNQDYIFLHQLPGELGVSCKEAYSYLLKKPN